MNIEQRFLLKAMEDKNFVSFMYEGKSFKSVKILKFEDGFVYADCGNFEIEKIKKIVVLREKFDELGLAYIKSIQDIKEGNYKIQSASEHIKEVKEEL